MLSHNVWLTATILASIDYRATPSLQKFLLGNITIYLKINRCHDYSKAKVSTLLSYTMNLNIFTFFLMFHSQYVALQQFFFVWIESETLNFCNPSYLPTKQRVLKPKQFLCSSYFGTDENCLLKKGRINKSRDYGQYLLLFRLKKEVLDMFIIDL